jgi:hypothetical protein
MEEKLPLIKDGETLGEDHQLWQRLRKPTHDLVALTQRVADLARIRLFIDPGHELPEIQRIAQMLTRARRQIGMQRDRRCSMLREMLGDGVFPSKPLRALTRPFCVLHHACYERLCEPQNECAGVLQDVTAVRRDAVGDGGFHGGADGEVSR